MTDRWYRLCPVMLLAAALCGTAVLEPALIAQTSQNPTFRSRVDSVSVDAIVTDRRGNPVTDLTVQDFEVREGGKVQSIDTFKLIQIDDGLDDPQAAREILSVGDQERETAREDNRLFVIFLDDYHVRRANSMVIRQRLAQFVSTLTPHDLVAIALPLTPMGTLTFSRNPDALAAQVMSFEGRKYDYSPRNAIESRFVQASPEEQERVRNDFTISGLRSLCQIMGTLREGRKTILFVSEGLTGTLPPGARTQNGPGQPRPFGVGGTQPTPMQDSQAFFNGAAVLNQFQQVFSEAARSNTAIYTLDPRGLATSDFGIDDDVTSAVSRKMLDESTDFLRVVASETDGRAIVNRNDPMSELRQMVRDNSTYYLLSYTTSLAPRDGRFHEIQVRVKRKDIDVRARKGYWAYSSDEIERANTPPKPSLPPEIDEALEELAATGEGTSTRPVNVWMGATRGVEGKGTVTLAWEVPEGARVDPAEAVDHVTITANSIYGDALFSGPVQRDTPDGRAAGHVTFAAPPGAVRAHVVAETARGFKLDASDTEVMVPDFTTVGPQLTTPFIYRGRTARDLQQIRAAAAPVPSIARAFSRSERLLIRFAAYGPGGSQPTVTVRLLNRSGGSIAPLPVPTRTAAGDLETEFGLGAFPPGEYLIEIAADVNGSTIKKLTAIRVVG